MRIALSYDHRGYRHADAIAKLIDRLDHVSVDVPTCDGANCDYPDMAWAVAKAIVDGRADRGILLCGSGIGSCITANKVAGIRAALVQDEITAEFSRQHMDANVICLAADLLSMRIIGRAIPAWLSAEFAGGRHMRRLNKILAVERGVDPRTITE